MAFAFEATSKNTFITFVAKATDVATGQPPRSRSAGSARNRPEAEELTQSLKSLTSAWNSGVLQPSPKSPASSDRIPSSRLCPNCSIEKSSQKPWDMTEKSWFDSNCSLSTMATDSATASPRTTHSESGDSDTNRIKEVLSERYSKLMVSYRRGRLAKDSKEFEFELDIEAGAAAAHDEATVEQPAPTRAPILNYAKGTSQMTLGDMPKTQNIAEMYESSKEENPTTLMIGNIPRRYTQKELMQDLSDASFGDTYDFLYLPMDKGTGAHVGHAFVNFIDPAVAAKCIKSFEGHRFSRHQRSSTKLARLSVAHLQGLEKNLQHYRNPAGNAPRGEPRRATTIE